MIYIKELNGILMKRKVMFDIVSSLEFYLSMLEVWYKRRFTNSGCLNFLLICLDLFL